MHFAELDLETESCYLNGFSSSADKFSKLANIVAYVVAWTLLNIQTHNLKNEISIPNFVSD